MNQENLSSKNLKKLIKTTEPFTVKRIIYGFMYLARHYGISISQIKRNLK